MFAKVENNNAKTNAMGLAKAVAAWKQVHLGGGEAKSEFMIKMMRGFLVGITEPLKAHASTIGARVQEASQELRLLPEDHQSFCHGLRNGESWKAAVGVKLGIKKVLEVAHEPNGLLTGPGEKVKMAKVTLEDASARPVARPVPRITMLFQGLPE